MTYRRVMDSFNKIFATAILVGAFVLFVMVIFGVFNLGAVLG
jgi:hypothetical protein